MTEPLLPYPAGPGPRDDRPASLARRIVPAVVVLGAAGGLLLALDHPGSTQVASGADGSALPATGGPATPPGSTGSSGAASTGGAAGSRSTTTTVPSTPTCSGTTTTVKGSTVQTRYGPVQVQAKLGSDGTVCAVDALQTPNGDRKSQSISQRAVPTLTQRAVAAGGTDFSGVSGATYTSNGYKKSLQSILDQG